MILHKATRYFSLNCLSISGYICFFVTALFFLFVIPIVNNLNLQNPDGGMAVFFTFGYKLFYFYIVHFIFLLFFIVFAIIEFVLKKRNKFVKINISKIPSVILVFHPYIFWIGIIFEFIPIYWLFIILVLPSLS